MEYLISVKKYASKTKEEKAVEEHETLEDLIYSMRKKSLECINNSGIKAFRVNALEKEKGVWREADFGADIGPFLDIFLPTKTCYRAVYYNKSERKKYLQVDNLEEALAFARYKICTEGQRVEGLQHFNCEKETWTEVITPDGDDLEDIISKKGWVFVEDEQQYERGDDNEGEIYDEEYDGEESDEEEVQDGW